MGSLGWTREAVQLDDLVMAAAERRRFSVKKCLEQTNRLLKAADSVTRSVEGDAGSRWRGRASRRVMLWWLSQRQSAQSVGRADGQMAHLRSGPEARRWSSRGPRRAGLGRRARWRCRWIPRSRRIESVASISLSFLLSLPTSL